MEARGLLWVALAAGLGASLVGRSFGRYPQGNSRVSSWYKTRRSVTGVVGSLSGSRSSLGAERP
jgi:hypothetical protein